jgi:DNA polymerase III delta prime subunit
MTSFLITTKDKQKRIAYAKDFCAKQLINRFDISLIEKDTTVKQNTQSIGIEDIKRIQKTLFLKPMKSKTKAVIIEDADLLTPEAQNALLKVLEEPPAHTIIILNADSKESLLPTILSRCQIIVLEEEKPKLSEKNREELTEFVKNLPNMTIGERLKKAEQLAKDKDKAIAWIERCILFQRDMVLENPEQTILINSLQSFQKLHTLLKTTNVNPRFAIENTLLSLV